jgi:hypothetical protein
LCIWSEVGQSKLWQLLWVQYPLHPSYQHCHSIPLIWLLLGDTILSRMLFNCDCGISRFLLLGTWWNISKCFEVHNLTELAHNFFLYLSFFFHFSLCTLPCWPFKQTSMQHDIPFLTVVASLKRLMRYSLGSVALGSLVVSVVEWVRFILECLRRKLKFVSSTRESCFGKATSSSSECCLGCIDWTLKSVNRNAYIMVSAKVSYRSQ